MSSPEIEKEKGLGPKIVLWCKKTREIGFFTVLNEELSGQNHLARIETWDDSRRKSPVTQQKIQGLKIKPRKVYWPK